MRRKRRQGAAGMSTNEERAVENRRSVVQRHAVQATEADETCERAQKRSRKGPEGLVKAQAGSSVHASRPSAC